MYLYFILFKSFIDIILACLSSNQETVEVFAQNCFLFFSKLSLDITIKGINIIIPLYNSPKNALIFNCESFEVRTKQEILSKYYEDKAARSLELNPKKLNDRCQLPPILENHHLIIRNIMITR